MKKLLFVFLAIISIGLVGCSKKGYETITYNELEAKLNNKETFVLFLGRETCSACSMYKEVLNDQANNHKGITIYYLDLDNVTNEEEAKLLTKFDISRTPTTYIIEEGTTPSSYSIYVGSDKYAQVIQELKNRGILK